MPNNSEKIVLGGGCFWCTEAVLDDVPGVIEVIPGYAGGKTADPTYEEVCRGTTGHAEVVSVEYDAGRVSLERLLNLFFAMHDPTSFNRQGNDVGTQYRSIILYTTEDQKTVIDEFIDGSAGGYEKPVVTEVGKLERFYPAEEYHKKYFEKNPRQSYCQLVISPKVAKVKKKFGPA